MNTMNTLTRTLSLPAAAVATLLTAGAFGTSPVLAAQPAATARSEPSCHVQSTRVVWPKGPAKGQSARIVRATDCDLARPNPIARPERAPQTGTDGPRRNP